MAFRGFRMRKIKEKTEMIVKHYLAEGVTLEQANQAAICIQRSYRRHTINRRFQMQQEAARKDEEIRDKKKTESGSLTRMIKEVDESPAPTGSVTELYGPNTPFNASGEKFGVDPPCNMAAPLLAHPSMTEKIPSTEEARSETEQTDETITEIKEGEEIIAEQNETGLGSSEKVQTDETGDAVTSGSGELQGQEEGDAPAPSSETKVDQDDAESPPPEEPSGSVTKVPSGEKAVETPEVTEDTLEAPPQSNTEVQPAGEETPQDAPPEENPVKEPSATEAPTADTEAQ